MKVWSWNWLLLGVTNWRTFLFMVWWIIINASTFFIGYLEQRNDPSLSHLNDPLGPSVFYSRGAGFALMLQGALILLPVCRNLIAFMMRFKLLRSLIPFDKNIHFHKIVAWTMLVFTIVHVVAHLFNFRIVQAEKILGEKTAVYILWTHPAGITGVVMLACMFLMYTSALAPVRMHSFELFWYTHHLALPFFVAFLLHSVGCFVRRKMDGDIYKCKPYYSYYVALPGLFIYICERIWREIRSRRSTELSKVIAHPSDTIEIHFKKPGFKTSPGQYVFINIPSISKHQWHPYTLSSCPEEEMDSVHIRIVGDWTEDLAKKVNYYSGEPLSKEEYPRLRIDGPYGTPSQEVFDYETVVLVGAGIGVTPFASILKSIWAQCKGDDETKNKRVHFIWVCRDTYSFEWFQDLLKHIEDEAYEGFLTIHLYLTAKFNVNQLANITVQADQAVDAVTNLKSQTRYGRPNFDKIFTEIAQEISNNNLDKSQQKVAGVFFCGPNGMRTIIRRAARRHSNEHVRLRFHAEKF